MAEKRFDKIMVAFDGSDDSVKAVGTACTIAAKFGSSVTVVHVFAPPMLVYGSVAGIPMPNYSELDDAAREAAQKTLSRGVQIAKDNGAKATGELLEAQSTVQALVEFSANEKINLVVMGTRGMSGFKKLVLGSVSSGLVTHAGCPVLVVR